MRNLTLCTFLLLVSSTVHADYISNGDFDPSTTFGVIDSSGPNCWDLNTQQLGRWYTYGQDGSPFYGVSPEGYAWPDRAGDASQGDDLVGPKLLQVIESPGAGIYDFSFRYRLGDPDAQLGTVGVLGIDDTDADGFTIRMDSLQDQVASADAIYLYDQGLPAAPDWTAVNAQLDVSADTDYIAFYGVFSYDGDLSTTNLAGIDDVSLSLPTVESLYTPDVPEPATLTLLALGALPLLRPRRRTGQQA